MIGTPLEQAHRERLKSGMAMIELQSAEGYCGVLRRAGCTVLGSDDISEHWTAVLVDRLAMYRGLRQQTTDRFGAAHFEKWDEAYSFFVGLYESGDLGGGRFVARRTV